MNKKKVLGQVFTPKNIVVEMLDTIGYSPKSSNITHKRIMEPSFGNGVFLVEIASRYIESCKLHGIEDSAIPKLLNSVLHGIEFDPDLFSETINHLKELFIEKGLEPIKKWDYLHCGDTLDLYSQYVGEMDFVVGNPPYIRIHNLPQETRDKMKSFKFTSGSSDLYIAFFELSMKMLNTTGKLTFITPNSFMKNTSQGKFREHLLESGLISGLIDYRSVKVFDLADTYATVTFMENCKNTHIDYELRENRDTIYSVHCIEDLLKTPRDSWNFADPNNHLDIVNSRAKTFSEHAGVQYGILTMRDKIFIDLKASEIDEKFTSFHGHVIENGSLKPVVKATKYRGEEITGRIIFPYSHDDSGKYVPWTEQYFLSNYPKAYAYLSNLRYELDKRDSEKNNSVWFQFGRSQGLRLVDQPKAVFSRIVANGSIPSIYPLPAGCIVYSGFFLSPLSVEPDSLQSFGEALDALRTDEFADYMNIVGKDMSGGFVEIRAKDVKNFKFD